MKTIYCISGLGADHRVFENLKCEGFELRPVQWLKPEKLESIEQYAERMTRQIKDREPVLLGLSFGGMMAIQISRIIPIQKLIIVSSVKHKDELPAWMKMSGRFKLDGLLPKKQIGEVKPLRLLRPIQDYFLGVTNERERIIANEFRDSVEPDYLRWSLHQVLNWRNEDVPEDIIHIHGDRDHIFPISSKLKPTHIIRGGGHFMIMNRCREIKEILEGVL